MLRPVGLPDPILNLRLTIMLILRHLHLRFRCPGWQGTLRTIPVSRWAALPPTRLRRPPAL